MAERVNRVTWILTWEDQASSERSNSTRKLEQDLKKQQAAMAKTDSSTKSLSKSQREATKDTDKLAASHRHLGGAANFLQSAVSKLTPALDKHAKSSRGAADASRLFSTALKLIKPAAVIAGLGLLAQATSAASAGAIALTGALAPLAGALVAYPAIIGAVVQGMGVWKLATKDLGQALTGNAAALKRLTPEAKRFVEDFRPRLQKLQAIAQKGVFRGISESMKDFPRVFGVVNRIVGRTSNVLGDLIKGFVRMVSNKSFSRDLETIGNRNAHTLRALGTAGMSMVSAFRHIIIAAGPLIGWLSKTTVKLADQIDHWAKAGRESGRFGKFFEQTRVTMVRVGSILFHVARGLLAVVNAGRPLGNEMLNRIDKLAKRFDHWSHSLEGKNSLKQYFAEARPALLEAGRLVLALGRVFLNLGRGNQVAPLLKTIRTELVPQFEALVKTTTKDFLPAFIDTLVQVTKLFGTLTGSSGVLTAFVKLLGGAAKALNWLIDNFPVLGTVLTNLLALGGIAKVLKIGASITGMTTLLGLARKLRATSATTPPLGAPGPPGLTKGSPLPQRPGRVARLAQGAQMAGTAALGVAIGNEIAKGVVKGITDGIAQNKDKGWADDITDSLFPTDVSQVKLFPGIQAIFKSTVKTWDDLLGNGLPVKAALDRKSLPQLRRDIQTQLALAGTGAGRGLVGSLRADLGRVKYRFPTNTFDFRLAVSSALRSIQQLRGGVAQNLKQVTNSAHSNAQNIRKNFGTRSAMGLDLLTRNWGAAITAIKSGMRAGTISSARGSRAIKGYLEDMARATSRRARQMAKSLDSNSQAGRDAIYKNFKSAAGAIHNQMEAAGKFTHDGMKRIKSLMTAALKTYGFTGKEAENIAAGGDPFRGAKAGAGPAGGGKAKGGRLPGRARGDHLPIIGRRGGIIGIADGGELVVNRHTERDVSADLAAAGRPTLDQRVRGETRRHAMAYGGRLGGLPMLQGGGHLTGPHGSGEGFIPVANLASKKFGLQVMAGRTDHSTNTVSGNVSDHSWGGAIDFSNSTHPTPQMDSWVSFWGNKGLKGVANGPPPIKQMLYRTMIGGNHFNHVHTALQREFAFSAAKMAEFISTHAGGVAGDWMGAGAGASVPREVIKRIMFPKGGGATSAAGQKVFDRVRKAAQAVLDRAQPQGASLDSSVGTIGPPGEGREVGASEFGGPGDPGTGSKGYKGDDLNAKPDSYAELGMGTLLGGLPYMHPLRVTYAAASMILKKRDIGGGGGAVGGKPRAIDLWYQAADALKFSGTAVVKVANINNRSTKHGGRLMADGLGSGLFENYAGAFGDGGVVTATRPTGLIIGDRGPETAFMVPHGQTSTRTATDTATTTTATADTTAGDTTAAVIPSDLAKRISVLQLATNTGTMRRLLFQIKKLATKATEAILTSVASAMPGIIRSLRQVVAAGVAGQGTDVEQTLRNMVGVQRRLEKKIFVRIQKTYAQVMKGGKGADKALTKLGDILEGINFWNERIFIAMEKRAEALDKKIKPLEEKANRNQKKIDSLKDKIEKLKKHEADNKDEIKAAEDQIKELEKAGKTKKGKAESEALKKMKEARQKFLDAETKQLTAWADEFDKSVEEIAKGAERLSRQQRIAGVDPSSAQGLEQVINEQSQEQYARALEMSDAWKRYREAVKLGNNELAQRILDGITALGEAMEEGSAVLAESERAYVAAVRQGFLDSAQHAIDEFQALGDLDFARARVAGGPTFAGSPAGLRMQAATQAGLAPRFEKQAEALGTSSFEKALQGDIAGARADEIAMIQAQTNAANAQADSADLLQQAAEAEKTAAEELLAAAVAAVSANNTLEGAQRDYASAQTRLAGGPGYSGSPGDLRNQANALYASVPGLMSLAHSFEDQAWGEHLLGDETKRAEADTQKYQTLTEATNALAEAADLLRQAAEAEAAATTDAAQFTADYWKGRGDYNAATRRLAMGGAYDPNDPAVLRSQALWTENYAANLTPVLTGIQGEIDTATGLGDWDKQHELMLRYWQVATDQVNALADAADAVREAAKQETQRRVSTLQFNLSTRQANADYAQAALRLRLGAGFEGSSQSLRLQAKASQAQVAIQRQLATTYMAQAKELLSFGDIEGYRQAYLSSLEATTAATAAMADAADSLRAAAELDAQTKVDAAEQRYNLDQARLQGIELQQQLAGTFDTGGAARATFITKTLIPDLQKQLAAMQAQLVVARQQGDAKLADQIALAIANQQNAILQAQLDAENAIKENTEPLKNLTGPIGFEYKGQAEIARFATSLVGG